MRSLLTATLDWCFPPRAEELRIRNCTTADFSVVPRRPAPDITCLLPFSHPDVRALVHEIKFAYNRRAHRIAGQLLVAHITSQWPAAVVVPVPLHASRQRERGFNQVTACLTATRGPSTQLHQHLLKRTRATKPQTKLSKSERPANVADAFAVPPRAAARLVGDAPLILVDDVYTTGATLQAARTAVRAAFPQRAIYCLTLAYA